MRLKAEKGHKMENVENKTEETLAFEKIAEGFTKQELVQKALESFQITAHLVDLIRVLSVDTEGLTPIQRTMYDSASARELRAKSRRAAKVIVAQYDANLKGIEQDEAESE